jgi:hypothetical protein
VENRFPSRQTPSGACAEIMLKQRDLRKGLTAICRRAIEQ